ncbi:hypothetical protein Tco_1033145 [Tanacetum coccineum]|uniref:Retroviral polymerase SH3-like domain-containing protein n=1 Tax=Tanacetum coccineum TaxID=301880 RepID=A0ABQ5GEL6_9ASTR
MLPEWSRFITEVKLNRGLKESNFDHLYAYLKQHEVHASENRMMMERFIQPTNDPLTLVSNASVQQKGFRIYNKRTRRIMETIHVTFDELHQTMAPVNISSGPELI